MHITCFKQCLSRQQYIAGLCKMDFCREQIMGLQCPGFLVGQTLCRSGGWCRSSRQAAALLPCEKQHWFGPHFFACQPGLCFKWATFEWLTFLWELAFLLLLKLLCSVSSRGCCEAKIQVMV